MKAQASSEFLIIIAALTLMMMPVLIVMNMNAQYSAERMALSKASFSAARLAAAADSVGAMGLGAKLYTTVELPGTEKIEVNGHDIALTLKTSYGNVVVVQASRFMLNATGIGRATAPGTYTFEVTGPSNLAPDSHVELYLR